MSGPSLEERIKWEIDEYLKSAATYELMGDLPMALRCFHSAVMADETLTRLKKGEI